MFATDLPWWNWALQVLSVAVSYAGAVLNAKQDIRGFHVWIVSNGALFVLNAVTGLWLLAILQLAYIRLNVKGIRHWREKHAATPANPTPIPETAC